ncbi:hypothetical protein QYF61_027533 [Mycteria americana]|uniref:Uncharacterized protein n=1 Tax=Mycteria americana TaxID=33587 RepID=A0AAN7NQD0_MYCAM|nr:hypothetical protein QYF61_027533 [Mycteria americana]
MESGLAATSANSLRTLGCISSGPIDLGLESSMPVSCLSFLISYTWGSRALALYGRAVSQGAPLTNSLKSWNFAFLKFRILTLHLTHNPQDCELPQCMITAAQAVSSLDVSDELTCIGDQQPVPMLDNPFGEEIFPNTQSEPPLAQLEAISSCPMACYLAEETDPHLTITSFQVVVESNKVSLEPCFLQAKQPQFPQPLLIRLLLNRILVPVQNTRLEGTSRIIWSNLSLQKHGVDKMAQHPVQLNLESVQCWGIHHFPGEIIPMANFSHCEKFSSCVQLESPQDSTLFTHIELVVHQDPQAPFHRAAPQPGRSLPVLHSWIMFSQVQGLTLVLVEHHNVLVSPLFQPIQIFLQGGSPFQSVHFPTQFGIISKLHQGTLDPIIQIAYEDIRQRWAQYRSLGDPTCDRLPVCKGAIYHHPREAVISPIQPVLGRNLHCLPAQRAPPRSRYQTRQFVQEHARKGVRSCCIQHTSGDGPPQSAILRAYWSGTWGGLGPEWVWGEDAAPRACAGGGSAHADGGGCL